MDNGMDELTQEQIDELRRAFDKGHRDLTWAPPEGFEPSEGYAEGGYTTGTVEGTVDAGELIVPLDADIKTLRRLASMDKEQILQEQDRSRAVIIGAGRRNGKELEFQIAQLAHAAGITVAELDDALRRVGELVAQAAAAAAEMLNAMIQTINDVYAPGLAEAWEEIQEMMEEYADADEPEEPDRHDGAVKVLVTWLLPVPTIYELYGQGVDHGGPGPSRLTLTRVTDDGLRRAETGQIRKGEKHDDHFSEHSAGPDRLRAVPGHGRRKGRRPPEEHHPGLRGYPGGDRSDQFRGVTKMKQKKGYKLVEPEDLDAAVGWAKAMRPEDPTNAEQVAQIMLLKDVLVTGLTYARVVAANMGGLPCFAEDQTQEQRQRAIMEAAKMARRPDGGKPRRKKGTA